MTEHAIDPAPDAPAVPPAAIPGFFDRVAGALHHGEAEVRHAAQVIEGDAAKLKAEYLAHAAGALELASTVLKAAKAADPEHAAQLEEIIAKALPVAETAARIAGAVLKAV